MKKTVLILSALSFFAIASTAYAQGFVPLAEIPGLTSRNVTSVVNTLGFANFFNNLYKYCIGLSAVLAIIMIIWGGLEYATQDIPGAKNAGKEKIQNAILGLVLVLSPVLVFSIINPQILNLSLSLRPLNLTHTPYTPTIQVTPSTVSNTESQIKQGNGVSVLGVWNVTGANANELIKNLDALESQCPGLIVPAYGSGTSDTSATGGTLRYVCQSCPTGTTPQPKTGVVAYVPRGSCVGTPTSAQTTPTIVKEGIYDAPQSGAACFGLTGNKFYCMSDVSSCNTFLSQGKNASDIGAVPGAVCTQY